MAARLQGKQPPEFPRETAIGALALYVSDESVSDFQPMNVNFGIISPLDRRVKGLDIEPMWSAFEEYQKQEEAEAAAEEAAQRGQ